MEPKNRIVQQAVIVQQEDMDLNKGTTRLSLFNEDGSPMTVSGSLSIVIVLTGDEDRPNSQFVFWIGGNTRPTNMGVSDIWFAAGAPTDTTAPTVPSNLFAGSITSTSFILTWNSSTDNVAVDHYEVRLNNGTPFTATSPKSITGLTANTLYNVEVRSIDAASNVSTWSTILPVTTSAAAPLESVFGASPLGTVTMYADGGGSLKVANYFYATRPLVVRGCRLWNPPEADSTYLNKDVTLTAYAIDWAGSPLSSFPTNVIESKVLTDTRVAGQWTEVLFDNPINLLAVSSASSGTDSIAIGYQFAGGNDYLFYNVPGTGPIVSTTESTVYFAEFSFPRGAASVGGGGGTWYGVDILFEGV